MQVSHHFPHTNCLILIAHNINNQIDFLVSHGEPTWEEDGAEAQQDDSTEDALVYREPTVLLTLWQLKLFLPFLFLLCPSDPLQSC